MRSWRLIPKCPQSGLYYRLTLIWPQTLKSGPNWLVFLTSVFRKLYCLLILSSAEFYRQCYWDSVVRKCWEHQSITCLFILVIDFQSNLANLYYCIIRKQLEIIYDFHLLVLSSMLWASFAKLKATISNPLSYYLSNHSLGNCRSLCFLFIVDFWRWYLSTKPMLFCNSIHSRLQSVTASTIVLL